MDKTELARKILTLEGLDNEEAGLYSIRGNDAVMNCLPDKHPSPPRRFLFN